ncbi:hypothetical protein ADUPG1_013476 [Aduncisulcus paluster]|uniref:Protein kinase domain-containing protein n=1 Tax=Aduncisulcus paluster TaxID=2918883 RepID=A0ABQ5K696_9EUKA|nr:hypothetical protein ADUPG1_013476 [Aduncisulcus paluster]
MQLNKIHERKMNFFGRIVQAMKHKPRDTTVLYDLMEPIFQILYLFCFSTGKYNERIIRILGKNFWDILCSIDSSLELLDESTIFMIREIVFLLSLLPYSYHDDHYTIFELNEHLHYRIKQYNIIDISKKGNVLKTIKGLFDDNERLKFAKRLAVRTKKSFDTTMSLSTKISSSFSENSQNQESKVCEYPDQCWMLFCSTICLLSSQKIHKFKKTPVNGESFEREKKLFLTIVMPEEKMKNIVEEIQSIRPDLGKLKFWDCQFVLWHAMLSSDFYFGVEFLKNVNKVLLSILNSPLSMVIISSCHQFPYLLEKAVSMIQSLDKRHGSLKEKYCKFYSNILGRSKNILLNRVPSLFLPFSHFLELLNPEPMYVMDMFEDVIKSKNLSKHVFPLSKFLHAFIEKSHKSDGIPVEMYIKIQNYFAEIIDSFLDSYEIFKVFHEGSLKEIIQIFNEFVIVPVTCIKLKGIMNRRGKEEVDECKLSSIRAISRIMLKNIPRNSILRTLLDVDIANIRKVLGISEVIVHYQKFCEIVFTYLSREVEKRQNYNIIEKSILFVKNMCKLTDLPLKMNFIGEDEEEMERHGRILKHTTKNLVESGLIRRTINCCSKQRHFYGVKDAADKEMEKCIDLLQSFLVCLSESLNVQEKCFSSTFESSRMFTKISSRTYSRPKIKEKGKFLAFGIEFPHKIYLSNPLDFAQDDSLTRLGRGGFGEILQFVHKNPREYKQLMKKEDEKKYEGRVFSMVFKKLIWRGDDKYSIEEMALQEYKTLALLWELCRLQIRDKSVDHDRYLCVPIPYYHVQASENHGLLMEYCRGGSIGKYCQEVCGFVVEHFLPKRDLYLRQIGLWRQEHPSDRLPSHPLFLLASMIVQMFKCMRMVELCSSRKRCQSLVHKDIKPDNFLLAERKGKIRVVLTDFGGSELKSSILLSMESGSMDMNRKEKKSHVAEIVTLPYLPQSAVESHLDGASKSFIWQRHHDRYAVAISVLTMLNCNNVTFKVDGRTNKEMMKSLLSLMKKKEIKIERASCYDILATLMAKVGFRSFCKDLKEILDKFINENKDFNFQNAWDLMKKYEKNLPILTWCSDCNGVCQGHLPSFAAK